MQLDDLNSLMTLRRYVDIAHHIPGRLRLRFTSKLVSSLSKNRLSELENLCAPDGYLRSYTLNTATGSLLLEYNAGALPPALLSQLFGPDEHQARQALDDIYAILSH
ncbi:hypothetical protein [Shimwellia blattae]|uniref:Uncharacterized protein n=1 Tax=Shimwellia blattae (strain ATCC 29907 / DSM 4481 / JCM 1650 / NBRC 105725 / CDC 9005-74) TaxID=630626 RepID=I2BBJ3_SHIBC|nr:hypothetical protein [Shimwellia blattae]AFJ47897.1 hypothetical protein EBL_c28270 [Shimwellia blattae DSM 4481 = NBRC 105725]GAB79533.1 hypothetical protein EB105725_01_00480 [Shimwellia blattae DSM 4481 = NBRC 105725]VDY65397.1 Uncharacterised protein [Shimwellia blattae]VEC24478.1 Uncharacterised protein [Shimwellia blattae]